MRSAQRPARRWEQSLARVMESGRDLPQLVRSLAEPVQLEPTVEDLHATKGLR